jgi:alpha-tubulin suppressor-like RCC1 family protein
MPIKACQGCLKDMFLTTTEAIDCFTGKELWVWGSQGAASQGSGAIGDGSIVSKSSPVQTISGGTNWKKITASYSTSAAIKQDGTLWVWGNNAFGQLGTNDIISRSSPIQTISSGTNWKEISSGGALSNGYMGGIKTDGTLWMWGGSNIGVNYRGGALGNNTVIPRSSPAQTISGGTNWNTISVGAEIVAAIKTDGTLWIWGGNSYGQLGTNNRISASSPVQTISGGTNWKQVSTNGYHTAAIKTDNSLWLWGQGASGQLGNDSRYFRSSPVQTISSGTNWKQVSTSKYLTAAIKTDGTLWLWGRNLLPFSAQNGGRLGDNTNINRSSPVQTVSGGTNWREVSTSCSTTVAIKTDGTLWFWGNKATYPSSGDNTAIFRSSPVQTISYGTSWRCVSAGVAHVMAIKETEF